MTSPDARPAAGYAGDLTPRQAWDLLAADERAVLVDVRTEGEWSTVGVPDVAPLDRRTTFAEWVTPAGPNPAFLDEVRAAGLVAGDERPVVFLCRSGQRSIAAARAATAAGLGPAYNVLDGFEGDVGPDGRRGHAGWRAEGLASTTWAPSAGTDGAGA
ncbi:rhodanese-like domain-containing protein [Cellulomonas sp. PhB143]|uniref:rhodanese-like domain-containing protein n=1 Tax=Cellulomonas sp. PhB143 TaxID=2485186 RepID=UPI000F490B4F|nr:rhodanese-like domain-containing protein [Cellulomonas sp. PhB143]ROS76512.1 rhodanese-related sulfurtransferase [Cellulomonas sp. PhB143]